jgi:prolipoprotein diacylglyceryltransferase/protein-S-isoprenylcysteine O-methyltransferase Ste14
MGKLLYALLFAVVLPAGLIAWAHATRNVIHANVVESQSWGAVISIIGIALILKAMLSLWRFGGGLPMNAFPPPHLVTRAEYALFPHPIYIGFILACLGLSIYSGSASGLWLVTPAAALGCTALVLGYESPDLTRRFGRDARPQILPADNGERPSWVDIARTYLLLLIPWLALYELFVALGPPADAVSTHLRFERNLPVWQKSEIVYFSTYVVVLLTPLLIRTSRNLRKFMLHGFIAMAAVFPLYWLLPFIAPPRPFVATPVWGRLINFERIADSSAASFPSFHVVWACIAASALATTFSRRALWWTWALLVSISCITTGSHSLVDVAAGFLSWLFIANAGDLWRTLLHLTQALGNSWHEWRLGPLRVINHGLYAALGVFLGMLIADTMLGPGADAVILAVFFCSSLGAALWAQLVEGSPSLLRPLGFYGGLIGGILGIITAPLFGIPAWTALCAFAVAAPVIQGIGRLRCVVQGCCHGRPTHSVPGIRCTNPNSRICRLAGMHDVEIHPTPLYSLIWNGALFVVLARLVALHASASMISGIYLLLGGMGRFVEEAYRGEPQTVIVCGLRLYQWVAVATVIIGAAITTIPSTPAPTPQPHLGSLATGLVCGALAWFVSAVDFPESSKRFARLT